MLSPFVGIVVIVGEKRLRSRWAKKVSGKGVSDYAVILLEFWLSFIQLSFMIPHYGFSPSNLYDFDWYYFIDVTLLLCGGSVAIFCPGRGCYRDTANIASGGYTDSFGNQYGRSYRRRTRHINSHTDGYGRHTNRQSDPAFHAGSICDANAIANFAADLHPHGNSYILAYVNADAIHHPNLNPDGDANPSTHSSPNGDYTANCNQYISADSGANNCGDINQYHRSISRRDADADIYTNTYGNTNALTESSPRHTENYGYI